jgi:hypothetical protein
MRGDMTELFKLTTQDGLTMQGCEAETKWGPNVTHVSSGQGRMCGPGFLHAYTHPRLALLLNPIYSRIDDPLLWRCDGEVVVCDRGLLVCCKRLTTIETMPLPVLTNDQRIAFAILCAREVTDRPEFLSWADKWCDGTDRTRNTARMAAKNWKRSFSDLPAFHAMQAAAGLRLFYDVSLAAEEAMNMPRPGRPPIDLIRLAEQV